MADRAQKLQDPEREDCSIEFFRVPAQRERIPAQPFEKVRKRAGFQSALNPVVVGCYLLRALQEQPDAAFFIPWSRR